MQSLCDVQHPRRVDATDHRSPYSDLNAQVMPRTSGTESETGISSATLPCLSNSHTHLHTHICTHVCREGELTTCSFTPRAGWEDAPSELSRRDTHFPWTTQPMLSGNMLAEKQPGSISQNIFPRIVFRRLSVSNNA